MTEIPEKVNKLRGLLKEMDELRASIKEDPDLMESLMQQKADVKEEIAELNAEIDERKVELKDIQQQIDLITGGKGKTRAVSKAPAGSKKAMAVKVIESLGVGGQVTPSELKDLAEERGVEIKGGYAGALLRGWVDDGFLSQPAPRQPYYIEAIPE